MWYLTIIRILSIIFLGISAYSILLKVLGWRMPGRLRRRRVLQNNIYNKGNIWIKVSYCFILTVLAVFSILLIKYFIRGDV